MNDEQTPALEAGDEVVPEVIEAEASGETENTEGQDASQPAEDKPEGDAEDKSPAKLRRERRKAEQERIRAENAALTEKLRQHQERERRIEQAAKQTQPPKEKDFARYEDYQAALSAHAAVRSLDDRARRELQGEATETRAQIDALEKQRKAEIAQNWADQVADAKGRYADFERVFSNDVPVTMEMGELIASSDIGADVAYYLGTNRKEARAIAQLSPLEQARAIGMIEARLSLPRAKTSTSAPAPITPIRGGAAVTKSPENWSPDEYRKWRQAGGKF